MKPPNETDDTPSGSEARQQTEEQKKEDFITPTSVIFQRAEWDKTAPTSSV